MTTAQVQTQIPVHELPLPQRSLVCAWILSGILLLGFLGAPPVTRTQEARVLETARQMLDADWHGWLVPHLNGEPRLKKPPLAYWLTALAYQVGQVSEGVGRIPYALSGWLVLGLLYAFASRLFDPYTALMACALLLGSHLFCRHMRLAETDAAATLFLGAAVYCLWRGAADRRATWMHLAAASTAMVVLAKGAPAIFVLAFLLAWCAVERRWDVARRFVVVGAPITFVVFAAPWFVYVHIHEGSDVVWSELRNTTMGGDHPGWPWDYLPGLLTAAAPWSLLVPLALVDAFRQAKHDARLRLVLLWLLAILLPLCINGNKQGHYLLMLTPPLMLLVGRLLVSWPEYLAGWITWVIVGMTAAAGATAVALPVAGPMLRGFSIPADWVFAALIGLATAALALLTWRRGVQWGAMLMVILVAVLLPPLHSLWIPRITPSNPRIAAAQIRKVGGGPYVFLGNEIDLPISYALRRSIPLARSIDELKGISRPTVVIAVSKRRQSLPELPPEFVHHERIKLSKETVDVYRLGETAP
jgi:4-amino-4-deoxy-L-arabinose transferase-like glycosyltransferase